MKLTIDFTVSVKATEEYNGDLKKLYTEEENRQMLIAMLKESCGESADITIHNFKLTKEN